MTCRFCEERKPVKFTDLGPGQRTMKTNFDLLFGRQKDDEEKTDCVYLEDFPDHPGLAVMACDTSSGEYAPQGVAIVFCPWCGKMLDTTVPLEQTTDESISAAIEELQV